MGGRVVAVARPAASNDFGAQHVEILDSHLYDVQDPPPTTLPESSAYSDGRTVTQRYDLELDTGDIWRRGAWPCAAWLAAVRSAGMGNVYRAADFGDLPICLDDLARIYTLQAERQYTVWMERITASGIGPIHVGVFQHFAELASGWLTILCLTLPGRYNDATVGMTFEDFHDSAQHLCVYTPNLRILCIALKGIETAEAYCATRLGHNLLESFRNLEQLYIITADYDTPLFNVIRVLAGLFAEGAKVSIGTNRSPWTSSEQSAVLKYLRR
jgi:hypothetical protein